MCLCTHVYVSMCVYYMCACMRIYVCVCMCVYVCVHMLVCVCAEVFLASSVYTMQNTRKAPHCELQQPQAAGRVSTEENR